MNVIKYMWKRKKLYLGTIGFLFVIGTIFIFWGIDVHEDIIKNTILVSVGTSLIAGGITTVLDLFRNTEKGQVFEKADALILEAGVDNIYNKRDLDEYDQIVKRAKNSIDVMGYSLRGFYQSYKDILTEKANKDYDFKVRILLVDADTASSEWRERNEDGKVRGIYKESIEVIKTGFRNIPNIEIRVIDIPLGHMIYRIDNVMYVGPYFYKKNSKSTNTLKLSKEGWLFKEYQYEFDRMWNDAKPVKP